MQDAWRKVARSEIAEAFCVWSELRGRPVDKKTNAADALLILDPVQALEFRIFFTGWEAARWDDRNVGYAETFFIHFRKVSNALYQLTKYLSDKSFRMLIAGLFFALFLAFGETVQARSNAGVEMSFGTASVRLSQFVNEAVNFPFHGKFFQSSSENFMLGSEAGRLDHEVKFLRKELGAHVDQKWQDAQLFAPLQRTLRPVRNFAEKLREFRGVFVPDFPVENAVHGWEFFSLVLAVIASLICRSAWCAAPTIFRTLVAGLFHRHANAWRSSVRTHFPLEEGLSGRRFLGGRRPLLFSAIAETVLRATKSASCGWRAVSCPTAIAAFVFLSANAANAGHRHLESWYADALAETIPGARTEVRMRNGTRCDVLTGAHAIEVDFGQKWGEGIGQSLNYSVQTGRAPAVAVIVETARDERGLAILRETITGAKVPISVIVLRPFGRTGLTLEFPTGIVGRPSIDFRRPVEAVDFLKKAKKGNAETLK